MFVEKRDGSFVRGGRKIQVLS
jgi:hypothetical protein